MRRICTVALLALVSLLLPARAGATENFPRAIKGDLSLDYLPPCSLCHDRGKPGPGTVITPFGYSMRAAGLQPDDESTVAAALATLAAHSTDSDGDGVPDVTELKDDTNPNSAASVPESAQQPGYGCGGTAPQGSEGSHAAIPVGLAALLLARRRRRR